MTRASGWLFDERREDVLALEVEVDVVERRRALEEVALGDVDEHARRGRGPEGVFFVVRESLPIVVRFRPHSVWGQLKVHRNRLEVC